MKHRLKLFFLLLVSPLAVLADTTFQEQAARLQNINAYLLDLRPAGAPYAPRIGRLEFSLDINPQPTIDTRVGLKDEPIDPPSIVPKVRARYQGGGGWFIGGAYAPGIEFQDYEAEYLSLEAGFRFRFRGLSFGIRGSYSDGDITGPITEPNVDDFFDFTNQGLDLSLGKTFGRLAVYGFIGANDIETSLEIEVDGAFLENSDDTYYAGFGVGYEWRRFRFNFEQNFTDDYLKHLIFSLGYRF